MTNSAQQGTTRERGWLHPVTAKRGQTKPTDSTIVEFTNADVRFAFWSEYFQTHQAEMVEWIKDRGYGARAYMFMPDLHGAVDELVYRFKEQSAADAMKTAFNPDK